MSDFGFLQVWDAVAAAVPDRECVVQGDKRLTWRETAERSARLGWWLTAENLGPREDARSWESPNDTVGILLRNCPEFLETSLGCYRARCAPFNVNYRYTGAELAYLLDDARASVLVYGREFAPVVAEAMTLITTRRPRLVVVADGSSAQPVAGSSDYDTVLADAARPAALPEPSPDDIHILYTGGTTGMPKGVMWRLYDLPRGATGAMVTSPEDAAATALRRGWLRAFPAPPLMHGAALWFAYNAWCRGATIVLDPLTERFDAQHAVGLIRDESITWMAIVGDVFATPLVAALDEAGEVPPSLSYVFSSGAALSERQWQGLLRHYPKLTVVNALGSSETGPQAYQTGRGDDEPNAFRAGPNTVVVSEDYGRILSATDPGAGWLASSGTLPRGYLGDEARTTQTFREVDGRRLSVSGDRAEIDADGRITFLGRASNVINSGGEKVYAEEVERVLAASADLTDAVVVGRPSERWGQEVVALVVAANADVSDDDLRDFCGRHLARYKIPKAILRVPRIERSPNGKVDYGWARQYASRAGSSNEKEAAR